MIITCDMKNFLKCSWHLVRKTIIYTDKTKYNIVEHNNHKDSLS